MHAASGKPVMDEQQEYDAFLSYSSADKRNVARIQSFLQGYRHGRPSRRVAIFRDYSDLSAGELSERIHNALTVSRFLIVVSSPQAAESKWVEEEIRIFDAQNMDPSRICVAVLEGNPAKEIIAPLKKREYLRHDLTRGWFLGIPKLRTRIELLRILSTLTGQPLRKLARWHLWKSLCNWSMAIAVALVPFLVYLLLPIDSWQTIPIEDQRARYPIFTEIEEDRVKSISRYRGMGPQGFRNYFYYSPDLLRPGSRSKIESRFDLRTRLLPVNHIDMQPSGQYPRLRIRELQTDREFSSRPFLGNPHEGHYVALYAGELTEEERQQAEDDAVDYGYPVPRMKGAVIVTLDENQQNERYIEAFDFQWRERDAEGSPTSPSMALSLLWDDELGLWIGIPGLDQHKSGGLWHSPDYGVTWKQIDGFNSVNSLGIRKDGNRKGVVVTERHVELWRGVTLVPYPSRAVVSYDMGANWMTADMPAFGTRSEIQVAGTLPDGEEVVRVDETIYKRVTLPRWRLMTE